MKYGLTDQTVEMICGVFRSFPEVDVAILYGSRARGNFREGSEIDLALKGEAIDLASLSRIDTALDDLMLPYTFDILLCQSLTNQALTEQINHTGIVFYRRVTSHTHSL